MLHCILLKRARTKTRTCINTWDFMVKYCRTWGTKLSKMVNKYRLNLRNPFIKLTLKCLIEVCRVNSYVHIEARFHFKSYLIM